MPCATYMPPASLNRAGTRSIPFGVSAWSWPLLAMSIAADQSARITTSAWGRDFSASRRASTWPVLPWKTGDRGASGGLEILLQVVGEAGRPAV